MCTKQMGSKRMMTHYLGSRHFVRAFEPSNKCFLHPSVNITAWCSGKTKTQHAISCSMNSKRLMNGDCRGRLDLEI